MPRDRDHGEHPSTRERHIEALLVATLQELRSITLNLHACDSCGVDYGILRDRALALGVKLDA